MGMVTVGFRRLYEALGLRLSGGPLRFSFSLPQNIDAEALIGSAPRKGIWMSTAAEYICLDDAVTKLGTLQYFGNYRQAQYPCTFFTEIICTRRLEIPDELECSFHAWQPGSHEQVLALAEKDTVPFRSAMDTAAGLIGLRHHRQLTMKVICEEFLAFRNDGTAANSSSSAASEFVEPLYWQTQSSEVDDLDVRGDPDAIIATLALPWLLRAWKTKDAVEKFIALFIPLEVCLEGQGGSVSQELLERSGSIIAMLEGSSSTRSAELISHLKLLTKRLTPSLVSRFEHFARAASLPGLASDIAGFKRFYGIRNRLFHQGHQDVKLIVELEGNLPSQSEMETINFEKESSHLEDLVERYVSFRLFGDARVYESQWRPKKGRPQ